MSQGSPELAFHNNSKGLHRENTVPIYLHVGVVKCIIIWIFGMSLFWEKINDIISSVFTFF